MSRFLKSRHKLDSRDYEDALSCTFFHNPFITQKNFKIPEPFLIDHGAKHRWWWQIVGEQTIAEQTIDAILQKSLDDEDYCYGLLNKTIKPIKYSFNFITKYAQFLCDANSDYHNRYSYYCLNRLTEDQIVELTLKGLTE